MFLTVDVRFEVTHRFPFRTVLKIRAPPGPYAARRLGWPMMVSDFAALHCL